MNKKLFAILLLIPMLVFVTDQVMGNIGPEGGKDKKKAKAEAQAAAEADMAQAAVEANNADQGIALVPEVSNNATANHNAAAKKAQTLKTYFTHLEKSSMKYDENDFDPWDEKLSKKTVAFIDKKLMKPIRKMDPFEIDSREWFSRCPSGYFYTIDGDKKGQPLATGTLGQDRGCSRYKMGDFRYNLSAGTLEMKLPKGMGYVSLYEYFRIRGEVMS